MSIQERLREGQPMLSDLHEAADRIDELKEANLEFHRVHQAWLYNKKPALEARIATLEADLREAQKWLMTGNLKALERHLDAALESSA